MMNLKLCYFSFFVVIYEWIRLDVARAEKVIGLDATPIEEEDTDLGLVQKRYIQRAIDPLMRRSPLDKNFMRFGKRSEEKGHQDDKARDDAELDELFNITPSEYKLVSEESEPKMKRIKQDFIRLGRGKQDFIRFGRGKQDFIRFGRGKQDFIRFGRGKQDFIRFGRGDLNNFLHYPETNFDLEVADDDLRNSDDMERDPRAKNSFIRFGRADNFIRFGRNAEVTAPADNISYRSKRSDDEIRFARGGDLPPALFVADVNPVEIRRSSGFIRLGRSRNGNRDETGSKDSEAGERRKRSVEETEANTTVEPKVVPKIGFKGLVVVPPTESGTAPEIDSESGTGNETGDSTELNDFPVTEPPEKNFHIPSIRHKRRTFETNKPGGPSMLGNNVWNALTRNSEYSSIDRLRPNSSKDYIVRVG